MDRPSSKFDHVYVIIRVDPPVSPERPEDRIVVTKVFRSKEAAAHEVERLNELNAGKGCRYFSTIGRLVREDT